MCPSFTITLLLGIKYSMRDLVCGINYYARVAKLQYASNNVNDHTVSVLPLTSGSQAKNSIPKPF